MRLSRLVTITLAAALLAALTTIGPSGASAAADTAAAPVVAAVSGVRVDPLELLAAQQTHFADGAGQPMELFGETVAISGDTAVVGEPSGWGVFVFTRSGSTWSPQAKLTPSDGTGSDSFGLGVAISGNTIVVGAPHHTDQGQVYVFTRSGTTWSQEAEFTAPDGAWLGRSVAVSGDTLLVGAIDAAYVFTRSGTIWSQQAEIAAPVAGASFGFSLDLDGDTALVGAWGETVGANDTQGAAYVFTRSGTTWTQQEKLLSSDGDADGKFGWSVALDGDTALVGRPYTVGAAYVFTRSGTNWTQQAKLGDAGWTSYAEFGRSVDLEGDTALVGIPWDTGWGVPSNALGGACVFTRSGTTWTQQLKLRADDAAGGDWFGYDVALAGGTALVGSPHDDVGSLPSHVDQGSAYAFLLDSTRPTTLALTSKSNSSLARGGTFTVKGTLLADDAGVVGRSVILQSATPGTAYKDTSLAAVTTSGGAFTFSVKPTTKTYYRVRFAGATGYAASGPTSWVYATPKVGLARSTAWTTLSRSKTYYAKGYIAPGHATSDTNKVRVLVYKRGSDGKYHYVKSFSAKYSYYSASKTRYTASVKFTSKGYWKLRSYHAADSKNAATYGSYDYFKVK
ncbi:MAG: hypothetical protein CVT67_04820 [Actinobacteria bacterium HGW-Actinobacteria-7]|jgi:hypothetical protein|nr:MAG: hypothetical protein CVT67_04820 [Actinobacteria bacterium HGW-Actinobacteria-7]